MRGSAQGSFTLSLDCEGLWGMADNRQILSRGLINDGSLRMAYDYLLSVLGKYSVNATAAFVSAFAVDYSTLYEHMELVEHLGELNPAWFGSILSALKRRELNGWSGSAFYRSMSTAGYGNGLARSHAFAAIRTDIRTIGGARDRACIAVIRLAGAIGLGRLSFRAIRLVICPCSAVMDLKIIETSWRRTG